MMVFMIVIIILLAVYLLVLTRRQRRRAKRKAQQMELEWNTVAEKEDLEKADEAKYAINADIEATEEKAAKGYGSRQRFLNEEPDPEVESSSQTEADVNGQSGRKLIESRSLKFS